MWRRLRRFWQSDVREEVDAELQFHLEMHECDLLAAGRSPADAREEAERRFGGRKRVRDACIAIDTRRRARVHRRETLTDMWQDLRFAFRTLRKNPGFTLVAVLCVGLGIGVTTTILSAVNAILIRQLPYPNGRELAMVYSTLPKQGERGVNISYPDYLNWRDENRTFAGLGIWTWEELAFSGGGEPERVEAASVSASVIPSLGTRPILGRTFLPDDEQVGRARVVLLGYGLWRRRFGGDSSVVGRSITVDGFPSQVIGVMPPGFAFPDRGQAWIPFVPESWGHFRGNRGYAGALGRLKPGVTLAQAGDDLHFIALKLQKEYSQDNYGWDTEVVPLRDVLVGNLRGPLLVFLGAVGFVLLIVCANVANLMLTRGAGRQREIAVRVAIGAGRGRLVRQLVTESLLLAAFGGVVGLALAAYGVRLFTLAVPDGMPGYIALRLDLTALLFAATLAAITGILFGLMPAFRATDVDLTAALREGTGGAGEGRRRSRARGSLVVAEVALSLVLLAGAGLLMRSFLKLQSVDPGFRADGVLTASVQLPPARYDLTQAGSFFRESLAGIAALPGVQHAAGASCLPVPFGCIGTSFWRADRPKPASGQLSSSQVRPVT
ncbi:MAG TPA: ABC transporter permease, partial [Gemmatimonadales bacterium]|nr:ABC transporter permease [Gemmatimonadales bacterium]